MKSDELTVLKGHLPEHLYKSDSAMSKTSGQIWYLLQFNWQRIKTSLFWKYAA